MNCIFCKIVTGEIPSFTVYEDELFKVIMDRFPAAPGHILIVSKEHHEDVFDMPLCISERVYPLASRLAKALMKALPIDGVNVVQNNGEAAGQEVFHSHVHLIPRKKGDSVQLNKSSNQETTLEELEVICEKIKRALEEIK